MRKSYGTTWRGRQWLNALKDIDFPSRLLRGAPTPNKGAVTTIQIDENRISASVQGSRRQPCKVNITIPRFDARTKARIVEPVTGNPLFLSHLLNRTDVLKAEFGLETPFLHGGVSRKGRDDMVDDFQNNLATRLCCLLSLKAGGTCLNLAVASNVMHYDL